MRRREHDRGGSAEQAQARAAVEQGAKVQDAGAEGQTLQRGELAGRRQQDAEPGLQLD